MEGQPVASGQLWHAVELGTRLYVPSSQGLQASKVLGFKYSPNEQALTMSSVCDICAGSGHSVSRMDGGELRQGA